MERPIIIETKNLIGLSFIIDEYNDFCRDYRNLLVRNHDTLGVINTIQSLIEGPRRFVDKRIREFYSKYATQINGINNHVKFVEFMYNNFTDLGDPSGYSKQFHEYLVDHRKDAYKILDLLFRLDKLGVKLIEYSDSFDFTKEIYDLDINYVKNRDFYYVDNIRPLPTYEEETIKYKTPMSSYEIDVIPVTDVGDVACPRIRLNTLLIEVDRLPSRITKENTFDEIIKLSKIVEPESVAMRNSVNFNVGLFDAEKAYHKLNGVIKGIDKASSKQEVLDSLRKIREGLDTLNQVSNDYDNQVVLNNKHIDHSVLDEERNKQLAKRRLNDN